MESAIDAIRKNIEGVLTEKEIMIDSITFEKEGN